jgi:hypothetical protein
MHEALAFDQMADTGFLGELLVQRRRIDQQRAQRLRRGRDPGFGPAGAQILDQPGQRLGQVAPADRQRPQRVHQEFRYFLPHARLGRRNHRMGRQPAGIAVARRLFAARRCGFD